ncbi:MAG: Hpt domain-containing protein [Gammaproteobacteria bacterium]|nr:Hpt domain-containing protein [Gammaproteobacteria bacterium]MBU1601663.1 Hpt domain-containing protein [Gammaproteobacteria bacterium]MBU2434742.1 Hpt domain-containing protein [Gammaproteobacteria bacterium]MBU2447983.1 Hpt domain-containing protein [Gammaproteobacteria bacterium]
MEMNMAGLFVLDKASILERLGGDEEIFAMMVDMFVQDVDSNCAALGTALASGDAAVLRREAHTVKGLMATFSDEAGAADAYTVELRARDGLVADQAAAVAGLQQRLREIAAVLSAG